MHGLVLGKFMPPHRGHAWLIDFATSFVDELTIVVGSLATEPIAGELRVHWMKQLYPRAQVLHLSDENPQYPHEHPDFWGIWKRSLEKLLPHKVDCLFASEAYGQELAKVLGARFVPANGWRSLNSISATQIRQAPWRHWQEIPDLVKAYYAKTVTIIGPESTGKTTLAQRLAQEFQTGLVPEYARTYLAGRESNFGLDDMVDIARGQWASLQAAKRQAHKIVVCDTDSLTTLLWCQELFGEVPSQVADDAQRFSSDLTLLLNADVPWVADTLRYQNLSRQKFLENCRLALQERGRPYVLIQGDWEERWNQAKDAVSQHFSLDQV